MNLNKFNAINEAIKQFITSYQQSKELDLEGFEKLHKKLMECVSKKRKDLSLYEEIILQMLGIAEKIKNGDTEALINKGTDNYHYWLFKLHERIMKKEKALKIRQLPKYLRDFNKILKSPKYFFKQEEDYLICTRIGLAMGHQTVITILKGRVKIEYNDHSPSRSESLRRSMQKKGYVCSEISVIKDIFEKRDEGKSNYLFSAEKGYEKQEDLEKDVLWFGQSLRILVDCDWLILDAKSEPTKEEIENETKILDLALVCYELFALKPKHFCDMLLTLIRANCGV
jgi:hypothetical protein